MCGLLDPRWALRRRQRPDNALFRIQIWTLDGSQRDRWYDRRRVILYAFLVSLLARHLRDASTQSYRASASGGRRRAAAERFTSELASFDERAARTERLLAEFERASNDLQAAQERLRISRARLQVLTDSLEAAQRKTAWLPGFPPASMTRVAAVDLGTNSTRLLVADVEDGQLSEVVRRLTITRLGEGVDERRRLLPLPIARVRNCLTEYRRESGVARRDQNARDRDERGTRRRERRGVPRRGRVELRVRDEDARRRRGGGDDGAGRPRGQADTATEAFWSTSAEARPSSFSSRSAGSSPRRASMWAVCA